MVVNLLAALVVVSCGCLQLDVFICISCAASSKAQCKCRVSLELVITYNCLQLFCCRLSEYMMQGEMGLAQLSSGALIFFVHYY